MTKLYSLNANGQTVVEVYVQTPRWLQVRPRVPRSWLRDLVAFVLPERLEGCSYGDDGSRLCTCAD